MSETIDDKNYREIGQLRETITALRTELAAAKQRVAELEGKCKQERIAHMKAMKALRDFYDNLLSERTRTSCSRDYHMEGRLEQIKKELAAVLPPDRITHIPGKEGDDGEMH